MAGKRLEISMICRHLQSLILLTLDNYLRVVCKILKRRHRKQANRQTFLLAVAEYRDYLYFTGLDLPHHDLYKNILDGQILFEDDLQKRLRLNFLS